MGLCPPPPPPPRLSLATALTYITICHMMCNGPSPHPPPQPSFGRETRQIAPAVSFTLLARLSPFTFAEKGNWMNVKCSLMANFMLGHHDAGLWILTLKWKGSRTLWKYVFVSNTGCQFEVQCLKLKHPKIIDVNLASLLPFNHHPSII